jgi:hypothetical protein
LPRSIDDPNTTEGGVCWFQKDGVTHKFGVLLERRKETVNVYLWEGQMVNETDPIHLSNVVKAEVFVRVQAVKP